MTHPRIDLGAELRAGDPRSRLKRDRRGRGQTSIPPECHDVGKSATVPGASVTVPRAVALALGEPKGQGQGGYPLGLQPDLGSIEAVELVVVGEQLAVERARQQEREGPGPISYFPAVGQASDEVGGAVRAAEDVVIELLVETQGR